MTVTATKDINRQVHDAIRPQLVELWQIEKHHKRMARLERLRQRYDMHDATDQEVELHATKQAFKHMGEVIGEAYGHVAVAVTQMVDGFTAAFNEVKRTADHLPVPPVPAEDHAGGSNDQH